MLAFPGTAGLETSGDSTTSMQQARAIQSQAAAAAPVASIDGVPPATGIGNAAASAGDALIATFSSTRARTRTWVTTLLGGGPSNTAAAAAAAGTRLEIPTEFKRTRSMSSPTGSPALGGPAEFGATGGSGKQQQQASDVRSINLRPVSSLVLETAKAKEASAAQGATKTGLGAGPLLSPDEMEDAIDQELKQHRSAGKLTREEEAVLAMIEGSVGQPPVSSSSSPSATPRPPLKTLPPLHLNLGTELPHRSVGLPLNSPPVTTATTSSTSSDTHVSSLFSPAVLLTTNSTTGGGGAGGGGQRRVYPWSSSSGTHHARYHSEASGSGFFSPGAVGAGALSPGQMTAATTPGFAPPQIVRSNDARPPFPSAPGEGVEKGLKLSPLATTYTAAAASASGESAEGETQVWPAILPQEKEMFGLAIRNDSSQDEGPADPRAERVLRANIRPMARRQATQFTAATSVDSLSDSTGGKSSSIDSSGAGKKDLFPAPAKYVRLTGYNLPPAAASAEEILSAAARSDSRDQIVHSPLRAFHVRAESPVYNNYNTAQQLRSQPSSSSSPVRSAAQTLSVSSAAAAARRFNVAQTLPASPSKTRGLIDFFDSASVAASPASVYGSESSPILAPFAAHDSRPPSLLHSRSPSPTRRRAILLRGATSSEMGTAPSPMMPVSKSVGWAASIAATSSIERSTYESYSQDHLSSHSMLASAASHGTAVSRRSEYGNLPLDLSGILSMLPPSTTPTPLLAGQLRFLDTPSSSQPGVKQWVIASATLLKDALGLSWIPIGGGRESIVMHLHKAKAVRTLPSSDFFGAEMSFHFALEMEDGGTQVLAAPTGAERIRWIAAIDDALRMLRYAGYHARRHSTAESLPVELPFTEYRSLPPQSVVSPMARRAVSPGINQIASTLLAKDEFASCASGSDASLSSRGHFSELGPSDSASQACGPTSAREWFTALSQSQPSSPQKRKALPAPSTAFKNVKPAATMSPAAASRMMPMPIPAPRPAFAATAESVVTVDMEAEVRARRRKINASLPVEFPESKAGGFYTQQKELPNIPAKEPIASANAVSRYLTDLNGWLDRDHVQREQQREGFQERLKELDAEILALKKGMGSEGGRALADDTGMEMKDATEEGAAAGKTPPLQFGNGGQWTYGPRKDGKLSVGEQRALQPTQPTASAAVLPAVKVKTARADPDPAHAKSADSTPKDKDKAGADAVEKKDPEKEAAAEQKDAADAPKKDEEENPEKGSAQPATELAAISTALEAIMGDILEKKEEKGKRREEKAEQGKKAAEEREKEKQDLLQAVAQQLAEFKKMQDTERVEKEKQLDPKSAIEALVASLNATKQSEAHALAAADQAIKDMTGEMLRKSGEQHEKVVTAVKAAASDMLHHNVASHAEELKTVLGKEVQKMFEEVGRIRETKRALEHEIGELFALKAKFFGSSAPAPKPAASAGGAANQKPTAAAAAPSSPAKPAAKPAPAPVTAMKSISPSRGPLFPIRPMPISATGLTGPSSRTIGPRPVQSYFPHR